MSISLPNRKCSSNFSWEETFTQIIISEQLVTSLNLIGAHSLERISGFSFPQFLGSILWCFFNLRHHVVETNLPASSKWDPPKFKYSWKCDVSFTKVLTRTSLLLIGFSWVTCPSLNQSLKIGHFLLLLLLLGCCWLCLSDTPTLSLEPGAEDNSTYTWTETEE